MVANLLIGGDQKMTKFRSLQARETADGFEQVVIERDFGELPDNDVLIKVSFSSLNYKDALSSSGHKGITKSFPHTPGIDAAGVVVSDRTGQWQPGDQVVVIGFDLGMNTSGGFSEYICVPAKWLVKKPDALSLEESMMLGTAGLTAGYCLEKLMNNGLKPDQGPILVTGATGGVGSIAVALLAQLGYEVTASTGKAEAEPGLLELGAGSIVHRDTLSEQQKRPMLSAQWAGAVDTVGGETLANILKSLKYGGSVAACGMVTGVDINTTVYPLILRGINLLGVASADASLDDRIRVLGKLASLWKLSNLAGMVQTAGLDELPDRIQAMLKGQAMKRVLVDLSK